MSKIAEQKGLEAYPKSDFHRVETRRRNERSHYIKGYYQAIQDFLEKACKWLEKELLVSDIEHQKYWLMKEENKSNFIEGFKNYMQDESEN